MVSLLAKFSDYQQLGQASVEKVLLDSVDGSNHPLASDSYWLEYLSTLQRRVVLLPSLLVLVVSDPDGKLQRLSGQDLQREQRPGGPP